VFGIPIEIVAAILVLGGGAIGWWLRRWTTGERHKEEADSIKQAVELRRYLEEQGLSFEEARAIRDGLRQGRQTITPAIAKALSALADVTQAGQAENDFDAELGPIGFSETTYGMKFGLAMRLEQLDAELKYLIEELAHRFSPTRAEALSRSQESWQKFRTDDAAVSELLWEGGTGAPLLGLSRMVNLTEDRIDHLRRMQKEEEGL